MTLMPQREFNVDKKKKFSEWYNTIIYAADLVDARYNVQGFIVHKPWSMLSFREIYGLFERELEKDGHLPCLFPTVIPEENFEKEKEHVKGFLPNVFWITRAGTEDLKRLLALRPTSETAFYQMYALWVKSKNDLPIKLYQSCTVFRNEAETNPFMRGREFLWIEAHDAFASRKEAEQQVASDIKTCEKVLAQELGLHFLVFQRPQWDTFPGAEYTYACDVLLPDGKVLQIATTHLLGQKFAKAFGIKYYLESGGSEFVWQTAFGPGIWRIMAALIAVHGDDRGLVFPFNAAPTQIVIVPIPGGSEKKILEKCASIKNFLEENGVRVQVDNSSKTPGYKFNYWEMKGIPLRIEVGEKELEKKTITLARRDSRERISVNEKSLLQAISELSKKIFDQLSKNSEKDLRASVSSAGSKKEAIKELDKGGFVKTSFCSIEKDGKNCADIIQSESKGGKVRGILFGKQEKPGAKCIVCEKKANYLVYIARQY